MFAGVAKYLSAERGFLLEISTDRCLPAGACGQSNHLSDSIKSGVHLIDLKTETLPSIAIDGGVGSTFWVHRIDVKKAISAFILTLYWVNRANMLNILAKFTVNLAKCAIEMVKCPVKVVLVCYLWWRKERGGKKNKVFSMNVTAFDWAAAAKDCLMGGSGRMCVI